MLRPMRNHGLVLAVLAACASSSKPHSTSGNFEDCYYDCKPGEKSASTGSAAPASGATTPTPPPGGKLTPAGEKAASLREAADLLDKAQAVLGNGNKNLADQLFSTAELLVGPDMLASLADTFHAGAPARVAGPTQKIDPSTPPQPKVVGSSEQEDAEAKVPPPKVEGSLSGTVQIDGKPLSGAYGLVTLEPASGKWAPRTPKRRSVEQRNREFLPHVL